MNLLSNSNPHTIHNRFKFSLGHDTRLIFGQTLWCDGPHTLWRLKDRVVNLQSVFFAGYALAPTTLEFGGDFVRPPLQTGIDGLDVNTTVGTSSSTKLGPLVGFRTDHARAMARL